MRRMLLAPLFLFLYIVTASAQCVPISATGPIKNRISLGHVQAATTLSITLDSKERTAANYYNGSTVAITSGTGTGQQAYISGYGGTNFVATVNSPGCTTVPDTTSVYEIIKDPTGAGMYWRMCVDQWFSKIGNGSGGALTFQYDASPSNDWSQPVTAMQLAPPGTSGQNGNDAEMSIYQQVILWSSNNTLRSPPRPQDGNLLIGPGAHTGTDSSSLDVGPQFVMARPVANPAPWSILGSLQWDGLDSAGNPVNYGYMHGRVRSASPSAPVGEFNFMPSGATTTAPGLFRLGDVPLTGGGGQTSGSWTPTIKGSCTAGSNGYSIQSGQYLKQDKLVTVWGRVSLTSLNTAMTCNAQIGSLPFAASNLGSINYPISFSEIDNVSLSSGFNQFTIQVVGGEAIIALGQAGNNNGAINLPVGNIHANTTIIFGGMYRTD